MVSPSKLLCGAFIAVAAALVLYKACAERPERRPEHSVSTARHKSHTQHKSPARHEAPAPEQEGITMQMLKSATKISFGFDNGSVAPEYQYQGYISVVPDQVTLRIYNLSRKCYESSVSISPARYTAFLKRLMGLNITPCDDYPLYDGGSSESLCIMRGGVTLFEGTDGIDFETDGPLRHVFEDLLTPGMTEVCRNPSSTF